jgi:hypothetical protein
MRHGGSLTTNAVYMKCAFRPEAVDELPSLELGRPYRATLDCGLLRDLLASAEVAALTT